MRLSYHPEADDELTQAALFYEGQVAGLGAQFLREWDRAIETILESPMRWPILEDEIRRYTMARFPYGIYYRLEGESLRILVVKHHSRHPDYWRGRL